MIQYSSAHTATVMAELSRHHGGVAKILLKMNIEWMAWAAWSRCAATPSERA
jgi:hypothetical protein